MKLLSWPVPLLFALYARRRSRIPCRRGSPVSSGVVFSTFRETSLPRSSRVETWFANQGSLWVNLQRRFGSSIPARRARVAPGRADRLVDGALYAVSKVNLGQVAVVHVAGEHENRGRGATRRALSGADGSQEVRECFKGVMEGAPVLEV